jgi:hypothetical protein
MRSFLSAMKVMQVLLVLAGYLCILKVFFYDLKEVTEIVKIKS